MNNVEIGVYSNAESRIAMDHWTQPFWEAGKEGRLMVPRCTSCSTFRLPPLPFCGACQSQGVDWINVPGRAELFSYTVCHRKAISPDIPAMSYIPVVVEIPDAGGVRLMGNLIDVDLDKLHIGMPLDLFWHPIADGWRYPIFRPASV